MRFEELIRDIPDFPKKGIIFKDITPLLQNYQAFKETVNLMAAPFKNSSIDYVVGIEARGFIFGSPLALELNAGFVPVRKPGKLPWSVRKREYELEYGTNALEIHEDAVKKGDRVLIVDDLLATGGTVAATIELVESLGAEVAGLTFLMELAFLNGRDQLKGYNINSLLKVE